MDYQFEFDHALAHMRRQRVKCASEDGLCLYRGYGPVEGMACVVGARIPDSVYEAIGMPLQGSVYTTRVQRALVDSGVLDPSVLNFRVDPRDGKHHPDLEFLMDLQECHDTMTDLPSYERMMRGVAHRRRLVYTPEETTA